MTTPAEPVPTRAGDEVRVGRLSAGDVPGAARLLATVFGEEPNFLDLLPPERPGRGQALLHLHAGLLRSALSAGHVLAARRGLEVAGVAVWLPPAAAPLPLRRQLRALPDTFAMLAAAPRSLPRLLRLVGALSRLHPPSPHWYLAALAVDPRLRGRGVGGRLVRDVLDEADRAQQACYLETQTLRNVSWYGGLGFEVRTAGVVLTPGGPPNWTMYRRPLPPASRKEKS